MEIERKFLVNTLPQNLDTYPRKEIAQGYINREPVIRIRRSDDNYISDYLNEGLYEYADSYRPCNVEFEDEQDEEFYYDECCVDWHEATEEEIEEIGKDEFTPA